MTSRARVHLFAHSLPSGAVVALCGWMVTGANHSSTLAAVTCQLCIRKARPRSRSPAELRPADTDAVWHELLRPARPQETTGWDGIITPAIWAETCLRRGEDDECGHCLACERTKALRRWASLDGVYERDPAMRIGGDVEHRYRYRNAQHAMEGSPAPSESKSTAGSFEELLRHGCRIQGGRLEQSQAIHRWVEDLVDWRRCSAVIFDEHNDRGLGADVCWLILRARVDGRAELVEGRDGRQHWKMAPVPAEDLAREYGVTVAIIGAIVKSGMRRLRVELAARELIPPPPRKSGLADEIERRRAELLNERVRAEREGRRVA